MKLSLSSLSGMMNLRFALTSVKPGSGWLFW